jgi:hypothetical protein
MSRYTIPYLTCHSVVQVAIFVGPWALPRAVAFYRSIKASGHVLTRPPPPRVQRCLNILYAIVFISILLSFPYFSPKNAFQETSSRLGLSTTLIQSRLLALRQGSLNPTDQLFIQKLQSEPSEFRFLYAAYGPDAALQCPFCQATEPKDYLYYYLPALLVPHLLHIGLLGFVTSSLFSGPGMLV